MQTKTIKVGIVEDQYLMREGVKTVLSKYKDIDIVAEGENGDDAYKIVADGEVDVLLLDLIMKQSSSNELRFNYRKFFEFNRVRQKKVHILIVSGEIDFVLLPNLLELGVVGYILKEDNSSKNLHEAICTVNLGGTFLSETVKRHIRDGTNVLTKTEFTMLFNILQEPDLSYKELGKKIGLAEQTIKNRVRAINKKLDTNNIRASVIEALKRGILIH